MINGNSMSDEFSRHRDLIEGWLVEQGFLVEHKQAEGKAWVFDVTDHSGLSFTIFQRIIRKDEIILSCGFHLEHDVIKRFSSMKESQRTDWLYELHLMLLMHDVEADGIGYPLKDIIIYQFAYMDGCTKDMFFQRLFHVRKGYQVVTAMLRRFFDMPFPAETGSSLIQ